jgi:hypothetical protein
MANNSKYFYLNLYSHVGQIDQLRQLEEEQEQLNSSLLALTTHFAQVQFRLKQIVSAPPDDKEVDKLSIRSENKDLVYLPLYHLEEH